MTYERRHHRNPEDRVTPWVAFGIFALVALLLLVVHTMDYHDAVREAEHCAEMVKAGAWPEAVCDE